jgi:hypothetical protein
MLFVRQLTRHSPLAIRHYDSLSVNIRISIILETRITLRILPLRMFMNNEKPRMHE